MKKLNNKYVESVVKKQQMAKSSRFTEKNSGTWSKSKKAGDEGHKKDWKTNMEARAKSTVEKYSYFKQEIPRKQITS